MVVVSAVIALPLALMGGCLLVTSVAQPGMYWIALAAIAMIAAAGAIFYYTYRMDKKL
jgi:hypothetical protein